MKAPKPIHFPNSQKHKRMNNLYVNKTAKALAMLFMLLPLLMFSCKETEVATGFVAGYDSPEKENGDGIEGVEFKIVPLEQKEGIALVSPKKVIIADSIVYILDSRQLVSYTADGKFRCAIGQNGHGRNEYITLTTFYVDGDKNIVLFDSYKNSLIKFDKNGKFLDEKKLSPADLKYAQSIMPTEESNRLFVYNYIYNGFNQLCRIVDTESGKETEISSTPLHTDNTMEFVGKNPCSTYNGTIRYIRPFDNNIYNYTDNSTICVDTKEKILSEKELGEIKNYGIMTYAECMTNNTFMGFTDIFETDRFIFLACHNMAYTIIDKETMKCHKFNYGLNTSGKGCPLYNIYYACNNKFIGLLSDDDLENIVKLSKGKFTENMKEIIKSDTCGQVLVIYDIEKMRLQ